MKVLVTGSRTWRDARSIRERLMALPEGTEVIQGGAGGADFIAGSVACALEMPVRTFRARWPLYGKRADILRNLQMLDEQPDLVLAFWDGKSRGTKHTIDEARKRGIPVEVIGP
jgi:hypothetical protein